jgi:hypothetical protein
VNADGMSLESLDTSQDPRGRFTESSWRTLRYPHDREEKLADEDKLVQSLLLQGILYHGHLSYSQW